MPTNGDGDASSSEGMGRGGKRQAYFTERNQVTLRLLHEVAVERGTTVSELAISATAAIEGVSALLVGASSPGQVATNARAATHPLSAEQLSELHRRLTVL